MFLAEGFQTRKMSSFLICLNKNMRSRSLKHFWLNWLTRPWHSILRRRTFWINNAININLFWKRSVNKWKILPLRLIQLMNSMLAEAPFPFVSVSSANTKEKGPLLAGKLMKRFFFSVWSIALDMKHVLNYPFLGDKFSFFFRSYVFELGREN